MRGDEPAHEIARPVLMLSELTRIFPTTPPVHALASVNATIMAGDFVTIQGPSGSGKSTLLNILGLLDRPTSGRLVLDGIDVTFASEKLRSAMRGQKIGFVFQSFQLLMHRTALENVAMARLYRGASRMERIQAASECLERVGLVDRMHAVPATMSGGERQRVAIARAIAAQPSVLLCDEPTGNLDSENSESIMGLLAELNQSGSTIIVITHDPIVAKLGRRRFAIHDGFCAEFEGGVA